MVWDYAEGNPLSSSSGSWEVLIRNLLNSLHSPLFSFYRSPNSKVFLHDATGDSHLSSPVLFSTDPPYYDNVPYADLSDFFYVWLRRSLKGVYPRCFATVLVPKKTELVADVFRFNGSREQANSFFEEGLKNAFGQVLKYQDNGYPFTVYYAFKQMETADHEDGLDDNASSTGWETMLSALLQSGFTICGTWPLRTEAANRMRGQSSNVLASSIILVCRKKPKSMVTVTRREFLKALKEELPPALRTLQRENVAPVDFAQSAIGPGMAVFSRYARVLEADGSAMAVRLALALINQVLDEVLTEQEGEYDPDTRWAVAWLQQFGMSEGPFGQAETLCKAKNVSVGGLDAAGIQQREAGRCASPNESEYPAGWDARQDKRLTVWEITQHIIHSLEEEGEYEAATILGIIGSRAEAARDLAYRLYSICDRKGWANEAAAYNSLITAWPELSRLALSPSTSRTQKELGL